MPRDRRRPRTVALATSLLAVVACASARDGGGGALEPRFVAVHNALAAMGLAQVGAIQQGTLAEGQAARVTLDLPAGCITVAAIGSAGVRDVDAALLDAHGQPLAHDTTTEPQAVLRPCLDVPGPYVLEVKAAAGAGSWVAAAWAGGVPGPSASAVARQEANGTCDAPIALTAGVVSGSTTRGEHDNAGSCSQSESRELVYELDVPRRQRVTLEVEAHFDSILYIRKDDCADPNAEVDCNDDGPDRTHSRLERVLEPGKYFVFVDGYAQESGTFKLTVTASDVLALSEVCQKAPLLAAGVPQSASTLGMADDARATCGGGAEGADTAWRAEIASRSRVRIVEHSDDVSPILHVRRSCADEQSEVACAEVGGGASDAVVTGVFEPGTYTVFADARERDSAGPYTLLLETAAVSGQGVTQGVGGQPPSGDGCGDALPLVAAGRLPGGGNVAGDTFTAHDDLAGSCGGAGAPDLVYRVDVARRSRFIAGFDAEEATHVLSLTHRCGEKASEVACGRAVDEVLDPGSYFLDVDGASPDAFGRFNLVYALRDITGQATACAAAPLLTERRLASATTSGASDKFITSCAGGDGMTSAPDRVFRVVVPKRADVQFTVKALDFDAALALRKSCADAINRMSDAELTCQAEADADHETTITRTLDPGTYWLVVDGQSPNDHGPFTIEYHTTAPTQP